MPKFNNEFYDNLNGISYIRVLYQYKNNYDTNPAFQEDAVGKRHKYFEWLMYEINEQIDRHFRYTGIEARGKLISNSDKFVIAFFSGAADKYAYRGPKTKSLVEQKIQAVLDNDDWGYMSSREFGITESKEIDLPILKDKNESIAEHFKKYMKRAKAKEKASKKSCCCG